MVNQWVGAVAKVGGSLCGARLAAVQMAPVIHVRATAKTSDNYCIHTSTARLKSRKAFNYRWFLFVASVCGTQVPGHDARLFNEPIHVFRWVC
jgi:hypothetical protein